jgi:hypothetical protein
MSGYLLSQAEKKRKRSMVRVITKNDANPADETLATETISVYQNKLARARNAEKRFLEGLGEPSEVIYDRIRRLAAHMTKDVKICVTVEIIQMDSTTKDKVHGVEYKRFEAFCMLNERRIINIRVAGSADEQRDLKIPANGSSTYLQVTLNFAIVNASAMMTTHSFTSRPGPHDKKTNSVVVYDTTTHTEPVPIEMPAYFSVSQAPLPHSVPASASTLYSGWRVFLRPRGEKAESYVGEIELCHYRSEHPDLAMLLQQEAQDMVMEQARCIVDTAAGLVKQYHPLHIPDNEEEEVAEVY